MFLSNKGLLFTTRKNFLNNFRNRLFPINSLEPKLEQKLELELEPEPKPKYRKCSLKLCQAFLNEIANTGKI